MKAWVISSRPYEEKIANCRYFETLEEAEEEAEGLNNWLIARNSRAVWKVYEAELTITRTAPQAACPAP